MNLNDKINRSRPGHEPPADPARHARRCTICHHPERDLIEEAFVHWFHADRIVDDHDLPSRSALYRHAYATGLYELRRRNLRYALEHLIEEARYANVSGDCVIRAIRAYSRLTDDGRWIEPPQYIVVERRDAAHADPLARPANPACPEPRREVAAERVTGRTKSPALNPSDTVKGHFLSGTPKQLETAAIETKQTIEAFSNRDKNTAPQIAINVAEMAGPDQRAQSAAADALRPDNRPKGPPVTRHLPLVTDLLIETPQRLETAVTQTKQTIDVLSNRDKITPPSEAN
jgi:hypothetical protein